MFLFLSRCSYPHPFSSSLMFSVFPFSFHCLPCLVGIHPLRTQDPTTSEPRVQRVYLRRVSSNCTTLDDDTIALPSRIPSTFVVTLQPTAVHLSHIPSRAWSQHLVAYTRVRMSEHTVMGKRDARRGLLPPRGSGCGRRWEDGRDTGTGRGV